MQMTEAEYHQHVQDYDGYCTACEEVTQYGDVEPDARNRKCLDCDRRTVMGVEQALIAGHIEIR